MQCILDVLERVGNKVPHPAILFLAQACWWTKCSGLSRERMQYLDTGRGPVYALRTCLGYIST